jgi:hypothetical protein
MPYFFKLSEKNNKDGTLNMDWVRTFIDVAAYVSYNCKGKIVFYLVKNKRHTVRTDLTKNSVFITTKTQLVVIICHTNIKHHQKSPHFLFPS